MILLSINDFFNTILGLSWLYPVLITLFALIAFFSFFQIIKNYQKKTNSKIIISKRKKLNIFHEKVKKDELAAETNSSKERKILNFDQENNIEESKKLFKNSKSLHELSATISNKAEETILSAVIEKKDKLKKVSKHNESFKVSAPKRRYSK